MPSPIRPEDHSIEGFTVEREEVEKTVAVYAVVWPDGAADEMGEVDQVDAEEYAGALNAAYAAGAASRDGELAAAMRWIRDLLDDRAGHATRVNAATWLADRELMEARTFGDCEKCGTRHHNDESCATTPTPQEDTDAAISFKIKEATNES